MRALDLFCCAGGASMGLHRAGFDVTGIDIRPQPRYPFRFIQADALKPPVDLRKFDFIWASPPCQAHTPMSNRWRGKGGRADTHLDLIPQTRALLEASGRPYVIENVVGAVKAMQFPVRLTGASFGLGVHRPRLFESNQFILRAPQRGPSPDAIAVYGKAPDGRHLWTRRDGSRLNCVDSLERGGAAMGIDWMEWHELKEAIPPAYSEFIARQFLNG